VTDAAKTDLEENGIGEFITRSRGISEHLADNVQRQLRDLYCILDTSNASAKDIKATVTTIMGDGALGLHKVMKGVVGKHILKKAQGVIAVSAKDGICLSELHKLNASAAALLGRDSLVNCPVVSPEVLIFVKMACVSLRGIVAESSRIFLSDHADEYRNVVDNVMSVVKRCFEGGNNTWVDFFCTALGLNATHKKTAKAECKDKRMKVTLHKVAYMEAYPIVRASVAGVFADLIKCCDELRHFVPDNVDAGEAMAGYSDQLKSFTDRLTLSDRVQRAWCGIFDGYKTTWDFSAISKVLLEFPDVLDEGTAASLYPSSTAVLVVEYCCYVRVSAASEAAVRAHAAEQLFSGGSLIEQHYWKAAKCDSASTAEFLFPFMVKPRTVMPPDDIMSAASLFARYYDVDDDIAGLLSKIAVFARDSTHVEDYQTSLRVAHNLEAYVATRRATMLETLRREAAKFILAAHSSGRSCYSFLKVDSKDAEHFLARDEITTPLISFKKAIVAFDIEASLLEDYCCHGG